MRIYYPFLLLFFSFTILSPSSRTLQAEVLWSAQHDGITFSLVKEQRGRYETYQIRLNPLPKSGRSISQSSSQQSITLDLGSKTKVRPGKLFPPADQKFLKELEVIDQGKIQISLHKSVWPKRKVSETTRGFTVSAELIPSPIDVAAIPKSRVVVESVVLKNGTDSPVVKVWSADVEKKPHQETQKPEPRAMLDTDEVEAIAVDNPANEAGPNFLRLASDTEEVVLFDNQEKQIEILNEGDEIIEIEFSVLKDKGKSSELLFQPYRSVIEPKSMLSTTLQFIRPTVSLEQAYEVKVMERQEDGVRKETPLQFSVLVQPSDGKAKVSWTRDEQGITFRNSGTITSRFTDIEVCEKDCARKSDIVVRPDGETKLSVSPNASISLMQLAGDNSQSGTIPPLNGDS